MEELTIIEQLSQLRITASSQIPPHEFLYTWNGTPCFAKGELVAVTGKAKSGKTYLNSLLMAAASGQTFIGLKSLSDKPLRVLWIDTEQSPDSTCEILRDRIGAMIGEKPSEEQYHVFNLRSVNWQDRMLHVVTAISICRPDLVIFDGIRDVVGDINNYEEAQKLIGQLLYIASEYKTCIVCVLHQNKAVEDKTLRGALGTELQNKSFETYECSKNPDTHIFTVKQTATRKYDMPNRIDFCLTPDGLPVACEVPAEKEEKSIDLEEVFRSALMGHSEMRAGALKAQVRMRYHITSDSEYGSMVGEALRQGIVTRRVVSDHEVYYLPGPKIISPQLDFDGLHGAP